MSQEQRDLFLGATESPRKLNGQERKDAGMALALEHAAEEWKASFRAEAERVANLGRPFTSEDVTKGVGLPPAGTSRNAIGDLMSSVAHALRLKRVAFVEANRTTRHRAIVAQWLKVEA